LEVAEIWTLLTTIGKTSAGEFSRLQDALLVTGDIIKGKTDGRRGGQTKGTIDLFTLAVAGELEDHDQAQFAPTAQRRPRYLIN